MNTLKVTHQPMEIYWYAYNVKYINQWEWDFIDNTKNLPNLTMKQLNIVARINETIKVSLANDNMSVGEISLHKRDILVDCPTYTPPHKESEYEYKYVYRYKPNFTNDIT